MEMAWEKDSYFGTEALDRLFLESDADDGQEEADALRRGLSSYGMADRVVGFLGEEAEESGSVLLMSLGTKGAYLPIEGERKIAEIAYEVLENEIEVLFYTGEYARTVEKNRSLFPRVQLFIGIDREENSKDGFFLSYDALCSFGHKALLVG